MIEEAESQTYYYHFDALGSVVALSDSSGDTVQTYQYSVFGQVAVSDDDFPNPYMFAGRRFDIEIGQYYNRARYYNPYTGRFLQTDPIGYGAGMNLYAYCGNSPLSSVDPLGLAETSATIPIDAIKDVNEVNYDSPWEDVYNWLLDIGFKDHYPEWHIKGGIEVSIVDDNYVIIFETKPDYEGEIVTPVFTIQEISIYDGYDFNGNFLYKVPVVFLPDREGKKLGRLDERTLNRIIKPTLDSINKIASVTNLFGAAGDYAEAYVMVTWDSYFGWTNFNNWYYAGQEYNNWEVNYIVGGHAANKFGWGVNYAWAYVISAKLSRGTLPWNPALNDTYLWFWLGYVEAWWH